MFSYYLFSTGLSVFSFKNLKEINVEEEGKMCYTRLRKMKRGVSMEKKQADSLWKLVLVFIFTLILSSGIMMLDNIRSYGMETQVSPEVPTLGGKATVTPQPTKVPVVAKVIFKGRGGSFSINKKNTYVLKLTEDDFKNKSKCSKYIMELPEPTKTGYVFRGWNLKGNKKVYNNKIVIQKGMTYVYEANWELEYYIIEFRKKGGKFTTEKIPSSFTIKSKTISLPVPVRRGYYFTGWYSDKKYKNRVNHIEGAKIHRDINLYAKWEKAAPKSTCEVSSLSWKAQRLTIKLKKNKEVKGYQIAVSTNEKFTKGHTIKYDWGNQRIFKISNLAAGTYYIKVRGYCYDSVGYASYGPYGKVVKIRISGSKKQISPNQDAATVVKAKRESKSKVVIKFNIPKNVKSSDDFYYLVKVNGTHHTAGAILEKTWKGSRLTFDLDGKDKVNVVSEFALAVKVNKSYKLISEPFYLENIKQTATNKSVYYVPASKKGMHYPDGDYSINAKWALCNVNIHDVLGKEGSGTPYVYNGRTYYFNAVEERRVKEYNKRNMNVTMVLYMDWRDNNEFLITPSGRQKGFYYYALNTQEEKARETIEAMFSFLAETYNKKGCLVSNWILGNEVNSQKYWNHTGETSLNAYMASYVQAFVMLSNAVQAEYKNAKVYIPLDGAWALPTSEMGWNGKATLITFVQELKKEAPEMEWNLAYHAYANPLTAPAYTKSPNYKNNEYSYIVGMKNIQVVTNYVKKNYGEDISIILSEQGYTKNMGESKQAASVAYAYYKAEFNDMIDAFFYIRTFDNDWEAAQGLAMGLENNDGSKREAYYVYKYIDTSQSLKYSNKYLKVIGKKKTWKKLIPNFNEKRFQGRK